MTQIQPIGCYFASETEDRSQDFVSKLKEYAKFEIQEDTDNVLTMYAELFLRGTLERPDFVLMGASRGGEDERAVVSAVERVDAIRKLVSCSVPTIMLIPLGSELGIADNQARIRDLFSAELAKYYIVVNNNTPIEDVLNFINEYRPPEDIREDKLNKS